MKGSSQSKNKVVSIALKDITKQPYDKRSTKLKESLPDNEFISGEF